MRKTITEFLGTFFLVMGAALYGAIGASLALMAMIYAGGHISGAHYNPAVSLAVWIRGGFKIGDMIGYWMSQFAGAILAAVLAANLFEVQGREGCFIPDDMILKAVSAEVMGTFALAFVVLNVATAKGTAGNSFYGLAIGGTVLAMAITVGQYSGGALNPGVALGFAIMEKICWSEIWIYLVGSFAGATLAALVFNLMNKDKHMDL